MAINKNKEGQENRVHWEFVESTSNSAESASARNLGATTTFHDESRRETNRDTESRVNEPVDDMGSVSGNEPSLPLE